MNEVFIKTNSLTGKGGEERVGEAAEAGGNVTVVGAGLPVLGPGWGGHPGPGAGGPPRGPRAGPRPLPGFGPARK